MSRKEYKENHTKAWCYFIAQGLLPYDAKKNEWCLHHVDVELKYKDPIRYNEWRIEDLVPMLKSEHTSMHQKGRHHTEKTKAKISKTLKGHVISDETKAKISETQKGRKVPDDVIKKRLETYRKNHPPKPKERKSDGRKGLLWINDGVRNGRVRAGEPLPKGWTFGRLGFVRTKNPPLGPMTDEHKRKISEARKRSSEA